MTNQIATQRAFNAALSDAIKAGVGALVDADMDVESTRLQALQAQRRLAITSLSIANQDGQTILTLFPPPAQR